LEQVHVRSLISRGLRLGLVAGLGIALAMPALALSAESTRGLATQTTLTAETRDQGGRTQATLVVAVTGEDGLPASGAVVIKDQGKPLAGVALNAAGRATAILSLLAGNHRLSAVYSGDATHVGSVSQVSGVRAQASATPDFAISVAPAALTLTAGNPGTVVVSITPENASLLQAPMFVTLSCSSLPDQSSCTFTPENVEIEPNATAVINSSMVLATQAESLAKAAPVTHSGSNSVAWAVLLPGVLGLAGLAWGGRRRRWLSRLSLLALVALVTMLGTTACNPRYRYFNHGPTKNLPTPSGTYTVTVTAQSSNGITATTHSTTMVLTVN
jgi:mRNA-degrading endonuclease toxin of MazEF toxin-antitoxin module